MVAMTSNSLKMVNGLNYKQVMEWLFSDGFKL